MILCLAPGPDDPAVSLADDRCRCRGAYVRDHDRHLSTTATHDLGRRVRTPGLAGDWRSRGSRASVSACEAVISRNVIEELAELHLGGDFLGLFIDECLRDALKSIAELERTAAAQQWDMFRDHCHALKGVAGNMGAVRLAAAASETMKLGNWQLPREWRQRIRGLREQLELARTALKGQGVVCADAERGPDRVS